MIARFHRLNTTNAEPRLHDTLDNRESAGSWTALLQALAEPLPAKDANATNATNGVKSADVNSAIRAQTPNHRAAREAIAHMIYEVEQNCPRGHLDWKQIVKSESLKGATVRGAQSSMRCFRKVVQRSPEGDPSPALHELSRNLALEVNDLRRVLRGRAGAHTPAHHAPRPTIAKRSHLKPRAPNKDTKRSSDYRGARLRA